MENDKESKEHNRITSFLNLLLGIDTAALAALLIPLYVPGGPKLPTSLPFNLVKAHYEFPFLWQIMALVSCGGMILILHLVGLWKHDCKYFHQVLKILAAILLTFTFIAIGSVGWQILGDPGLLKTGARS